MHWHCPLVGDDADVDSAPPLADDDGPGSMGPAPPEPENTEQWLPLASQLATTELRAELPALATRTEVAGTKLSGRVAETYVALWQTMRYKQLGTGFKATLETAMPRCKVCCCTGQLWQ